MLNTLAYSSNIFGTSLTWYALFVLTGAFLTFFISRYMYKKDEISKKYPSLIDDLFLIVFPAGILGARLWYVISEWSYYSQDFFSIFKTWEGGLAIQGGVMGGVLAGILYIKLRKIQVPILKMFDFIIPNILIAQAIGRWGNFFNQEVYGACVNKDNLSLIPDFILNNMSGGQISCGINEVAQPLFLYESLLNLFGFIFISIVLRKMFKNRNNGDLAAYYAIWYGSVRLIMEPLRSDEFIMRIFGEIPLSIATSILFIVLGLTFVLLVRLIPYIKNKREVK